MVNINICEQFVLFDTAKLLKEAGFAVPCFNQYTERGTIWHCDCPENFNKSQCATSCPTQALAARWLREVHHINVYACFDYEKFEERKWFFTREHTMVNDDSAVYCSITNYNSYEEALEAGLKHGLELIKK
jgi:hypothetical protein